MKQPSKHKTPAELAKSFEESGIKPGSKGDFTRVVEKAAKESKPKPGKK